MSTGIEWTDQLVETLKRLWGDGLSCSQIAAEMGLGLTRNSIIGKVHRLKLRGRRENTWKARGNKRKARKPFLKKKPERGVQIHAVRAPKLEPEVVVFTAGTWDALPGTTPVGIEALSDSVCRWPLGEAYGPPATLFCGCATASGSSYCKEHAKRAKGKGNANERYAVKTMRRAVDYERYVREAA